jgi:hypothetical protein
MTFKTIALMFVPLVTTFAAVQEAAAYNPDYETPFCGDGVCNGREDYDTCEDDCVRPICGDGECNGSETQSSCPDDCVGSTGGDGGPVSLCGPFNDVWSWSTGFDGELVSARAGITMSTSGAAGGVSNLVNVFANLSLVGQPMSLLDMTATGSANGVGASGSAAITVRGLAIFGGPATTTGGTATKHVPLTSWVLYQNQISTGVYCDPWLHVACAKADAEVTISADAVLSLSETVSNLSTEGFLGPEAYVTATVIGKGSVCIGPCVLDWATLSINGVATLADLRIGGKASVAATSGSFAPGATVDSYIGIGADFAMGAGTVDMKLDGCVNLFFTQLCTNFFTYNGLNWGAPIAATVNAGTPATHCL